LHKFALTKLQVKLGTLHPTAAWLRCLALEGKLWRCREYGDENY